MFLPFVFSFLASRNRISLSPRRAERCSAVHWRTGQSNVMFVKTAGCCRWCKILWISSGLKGLEQSDSAMVWKTQQSNRRRCDNEQCYHTVTHNLNACWWWRYSDTRWLLLQPLSGRFCVCDSRHLSFFKNNSKSYQWILMTFLEKNDNNVKEQMTTFWYISDSSGCLRSSKDDLWPTGFLNHHKWLGS